MTTKLHKAYRLNKKTYYYHKCDCGNTFTARDDKKPKSCGCLQGRPKSVDIETNTNNVEIIPKTHKRCYMCKELLSLDSFHKGCSKCKECTKTYNKQWQEENRDKSREYNYKHRLRVLGLTEEEYIELVKYREKVAQENKQKALIRKQEIEEQKQQQELLKLSPTKQCIKCNEIKPKSEFHKAKSKWDGYDNRCKECEKLRLRQERGHGPRVVATEEEKRIRRRINKHQRRLREKNGGPKATPKQIIELKKRQKNRCYWCYTDISKAYHQDHYIALKNFGDNSIDNIVLTCPKCNMSKGKKSPLEFANKKGRLL